MDDGALSTLELRFIQAYGLIFAIGFKSDALRQRVEDDMQGDDLG